MNKKKLKDSYKNLKVLVTGSTGFKGAWLCYWLNKLKSKVVGVGLRPEKQSILFQELFHTQEAQFDVVLKFLTNVNRRNLGFYKEVFLSKNFFLSQKLLPGPKTQTSSGANNFRIIIISAWFT